MAGRALVLMLACAARSTVRGGGGAPARIGGVLRARARVRLGPPSRAAPPRVVPLRTALGAYDALLLDQFGVLHDGRVAYAGATSAMRELQRLARKRIVVLSNSSKRRIETVNRLHALGLGMCTWLDGSASVADGVPLISVVTSGDIVWKELRARMRAPPPEPAPAPTPAPAREGPADPFAIAGGACIVYGNGDDDDEYVSSAGCEPADVERAHFILARGLFEVRTGRGPDGAVPFDARAHGDELLVAAHARGLPMIVANPDLVRPDGRDSPMPGVIAARYERMGGDVRYVGKPHALVYAVAAAQLRDEGVPPARVVAVGDSMEHDVLGARRAGLDAILITGGVHAAELGVRQGVAETPSAERLAAFLERYPADEWPTHVCAGFVLD